MAEYSMKWGAGHPGCAIFLLDWSASMGEKYEAGKVGKGQTKADTLANVLNNAIVELRDKCVKGKIISHRADIALVGYGGTVESVFASRMGTDLVPIDKLAENPLRVEMRTDEDVSPTGKLLKFEAEFPIWVEPVERGNMPMCGALRLAKEIAESWIKDDHKHCFPPVVINITDGAATDGDPRPEAEQLRQLRTDDGALLMFNCHLSAHEPNQIKYPGSVDELPNDNYAAVLFEMSSEIPEKLRELAAASDLKAGDRGFVLNGDAKSVIDMIQMGTDPGQGAADDPSGEEDMPTI